MRASWNGTTIAESEETREAGGYRYFPPASVRTDLLERSPKTPRDLECPHGVQFYDLVADGARSERGAWAYEAPQPVMESVRDWIGFWGDVQVEP